MVYKIFPKPAKSSQHRQQLRLEGRTFIRLTAAHSENFLTRLKEFSDERRLPLELTYGRPDPSATLLELRLKRSSSRPEHYSIDSNEAGFGISAATELGLFRGLCSLAQYLDQCDQSAPYLSVEDAPDFGQRGIMLDISRCKVPSLDTLKTLIKQCARLKFNQIQLYTEHTFKFRQHPLVWAEASPLNATEIIELKHFAAAHYIDLVPNLNCFGHFERWLRHPEYHRFAECPNGFTHPLSHRDIPYGSTLSPTPASRKLIDSLHEEYLPLFDGQFFNIGGDEPWELGLGRSRKICEQQGKTNVYVDFLQDIQKLVEKRGRRMMFWSDIVLKEPSSLKRISRHSIALNWGYEANHPFRAESEHMAEHKIPFYVCPGTSSWNSLIGRTKNMFGNIKSAAKQGKAYGSKGLLLTDWGDYGHHQYQPFSYPGFAAAACESWHQGSLQRADLAEVTNRFFLQEHTTNTAQGIIDLGTVLEEANTNLRNATIFNQLLFWSMKREPRNTQKLSRKQLQNCLDRLETAPTSEQPLVRDELQNAVAAARTGVKRLLTHRYDAFSKSELRRDLSGVIGEHERLWLARNRPGGLRESVGHLERAKAVL